MYPSEQNKELRREIQTLKDKVVNLELMLKTKRQRQVFVNELVQLRKEGLHNRNACENEINNANAHPTYVAFERQWHQHIVNVMQQYGCTASEISRVSDLTESEIKAAAPRGPHPYGQRWLIGLMELRVQRLQQLIDKHNLD